MWSLTILMQVLRQIFKRRWTWVGLAFIFLPIWVCEVEGGNPRQDCMSLSWGLFHFGNKWHSDTMVSLTAPFSWRLLQVLCVATIRPVSNRVCADLISSLHIPKPNNDVCFYLMWHRPSIVSVVLGVVCSWVHIWTSWFIIIMVSDLNSCLNWKAP